MATTHLIATDDPGSQDREAARCAADELERLLEDRQQPAAEGAGSVMIPSLPLPAEALRVLRATLAEMAAGHRVVLQRADDGELTTNQAAELLGISRPTLIDLLESEEVPYRMVGTHRRIRLSSVQELAKRLERGTASVPRAESIEGRRQALREVAEWSKSNRPRPARDSY